MAKIIGMLEWLQCFTSRYLLQVRLENVDNPGWYLEIPLENSDLSNKSFKAVKIDRTEDDWVHCLVRNGVLIGAGGSKNLGDILQLFCNWVESVDKSFIDHTESTGEAFKDTGVTEWMESWFTVYCDGDWEHDSVFLIEFNEDREWSVSIKLEGTSGEGESMRLRELKNTNSDWLRCYTKSGRFYGHGGIYNLVGIISEFREWISQFDEKYTLESSSS